MSRRQTTAPTRTETRDGYEEEHPAFGVAIVSRSQGTPRALFQSDLQHSETITLSVQRATRGRHLMHDWIHPRSRALVEVEMSLAQWGALVSSIGIGSGVPVTIRHTENDIFVDDLPYEPRTAEVLDEAKGTVSRMLDRVRKTLTHLEGVIENRAGVRATREALRDHVIAVESIESNVEFAVKSVNRATEHVVAQAKADIETAILQAQQAGAAASIEAPSFEQKAVEQ